MDIAYELSELERRARRDAEVRRKLLATREAGDPIAAFCDECARLGYENITVYGLATQGEAFCAAMLRSVNGGGVEAPDDWDDFYGMFMTELENI